MSGNGQTRLRLTSVPTERLMMKVMSAGWLRERPLILNGSPVHTLPAMRLPLGEMLAARLQVPAHPAKCRARLFWRRQRVPRAERVRLRLQCLLALHLHVGINLHLNNSLAVRADHVFRRRSEAEITHRAAHRRWLAPRLPIAVHPGWEFQPGVRRAHLMSAGDGTTTVATSLRAAAPLHRRATPQFQSFRSRPRAATPALQVGSTNEGVSARMPVRVARVFEHRWRVAPMDQPMAIQMSVEPSAPSSAMGWRGGKGVAALKPVSVWYHRRVRLPTEGMRSTPLPRPRAEIVWRRGNEVEAPDSQRAAPPFASSRSARVSARPAAITTSSVSRGADLASTAVLRPSASLRLDSAMTDRLAEDVIQRVERRMRIERERRGL